jgi:hypothetical protein
MSKSFLLNLPNTTFYEKLYSRPEIVNEDSLIYGQSWRSINKISQLFSKSKFVLVNITPFHLIPFCLYVIRVRYFRPAILSLGSTDLWGEGAILDKKEITLFLLP